MRVFVIAFSLFFTCSLVAAQEFPSDPEHVTSQSQVEALDDNSLGIADPNSVRVLAGIALEVIKVFESWRPDAYNDASKFCTIGYGHLIAKKDCASVLDLVASFSPPLDAVEGNALLDADTISARLSVQNLVDVELDDNQFGALTSFVFNVGAGNFERSTLRKYLNNGEFAEAAEQFPRWVMSAGVPLNGLIARRACEALLFQGVVELSPDGSFDRTSCDGSGLTASSEDLIDIVAGE